MAEETYPKESQEVLATLIGIFSHQKNTEIADLLSAAHARFESTDYDNWNGGTTTWALRLEVPLVAFASIESRLEEIETSIRKKLAVYDRLHPNDPIGEVTITPFPSGQDAIGEKYVPSDSETARIWQKDRFRLFLSHLSADKDLVSELKIELREIGVSSFVAHEDISPSLEWQDEIELGLRSMHALAAILTPDFHDSDWTDHEIGWALGRGLLVLPIRVGRDPYGLAGKIQAVRGSLKNPNALATSIVTALLTHRLTRGNMRRSLVAAFAEASSFEMARNLRNHLITVDDFTEDEKTMLRRACTENGQVSKAFGVPEAIYGHIGKSKTKSPASKHREIDF